MRRAKAGPVDGIRDRRRPDPSGRDPGPTVIDRLAQLIDELDGRGWELLKCRCPLTATGSFGPSLADLAVSPSTLSSPRRPLRTGRGLDIVRVGSSQSVTVLHLQLQLHDGADCRDGIRRLLWWLLGDRLGVMALVVSATSAGRGPRPGWRPSGWALTTQRCPVGGVGCSVTDTTTTSANGGEPTSTGPMSSPRHPRPTVRGPIQPPWSTASTAIYSPRPGARPPKANDSTVERPTDVTLVGTVAGDAASTIMTVGAPPGPVQMQPGNLESPDNVSATYPVTTASGVLSAEVTWQGDSALDTDPVVSRRESIGCRPCDA